MKIVKVYAKLSPFMVGEKLVTKSSGLLIDSQEKLDSLPAGKYCTAPLSADDALKIISDYGDAVYDLGGFDKVVTSEVVEPVTEIPTKPVTVEEPSDEEV